MPLPRFWQASPLPSPSPNWMGREALPRIETSWAQGLWSERAAGFLRARPGRPASGLVPRTGLGLAGCLGASDEACPKSSRIKAGAAGLGLCPAALGKIQNGGCGSCTVAARSPPPQHLVVVLPWGGGVQLQGLRSQPCWLWESAGVELAPSLVLHSPLPPIPPTAAPSIWGGSSLRLSPQTFSQAGQAEVGCWVGVGCVPTLGL